MIDSVHIIGSKGLGGAERFYMRLVGALNQRGHTALAVTRSGGRVCRKLNGLVRHIQVPMRNGWDIFSAWTIRKLLLKYQPRIVQTYMGRASRLTRLPGRCRSIHVARLGGYYKIRGYYGHAHAWVGNTSGICDYLTGQGLPAERVYRIGNFVDIPDPTPLDTRQLLRSSLEIPADGRIVFTLGRFIPKKGFGDLLSAFAALLHQPSPRPLYLVIAGDGPLKAKLRAQAAALGLGDRLRWVGWQDLPGVYYDLADVFVCPSHHEPLGNVILEAWAHRLPVIATRTSGALELIEDGKNGVLVPCQDPQALSQHLFGLLEAGRAGWRRLAENGFNTLAAGHSQAAIVEAYLAMYAELQTKVRQVDGEALKHL